MCIQLKDLNDVLVCREIKLYRKDTKQVIRATVAEILEYGEMYVYRIDHKKKNTVISIQKVPKEI